MSAGCTWRKEFSPLPVERRATRRWSPAAGENAASSAPRRSTSRRKQKRMSVDGHVVREGEWITLDGGDGIGLQRPDRSGAARAAQSVRNVDEMGGQTPETRRAHQCRHPAGCAGGARNGRRGNRAVPHRAHVLQGFRASRKKRRAATRYSGNDSRRNLRSAAQGARQSCCRSSVATSSGSSKPWTDCRSPSG